LISKIAKGATTLSSERIQGVQRKQLDSLIKFVGNQMTEREIIDTLQQIHIDSLLQQLVLSFFRNNHNMMHAIHDLIDQGLVSRFSAIRLEESYRALEWQIFHTLYEYIDLTPEIKGVPTNYQIKKIQFLKYDSFCLEDEQHLIVITKINFRQFLAYWLRGPSEVDQARFGQIYVMKQVDGHWTRLHDEFAENYVAAYKMMENL
jgi:hypothetical protein